MKRIQMLMTGALLLLAVVSMQAQPGKGTPPKPEERAKFTVDRLAEKITVTPVEQDSLLSIFTVFFTDQQTKRGSGDWEAMKQLGDARDARVRELFNNDEKYDSYLAFMKEQRGRRPGAMPEQGTRKPRKENPEKQ